MLASHQKSLSIKDSFEFLLNIDFDYAKVLYYFKLSKKSIKFLSSFQR